MRQTLAQKVVGRSRSNFNKLQEGVQERISKAKEDTVAAEEAAEAFAEENETLKATIEKLRSKMDSTSRGKFDELRATEPGLQIGKVGTATLMDFLGKKGEEYSQEIIELGLRLMAACLSGAQAVSVVRAFATLLHPDKVEGHDYRVPSAKRFNEWRRYLEPICHFIAVSTINLAIRTHNSNDATTKKHKHILMAVCRCELPSGIIVDVVSFNLNLRFLC